MMFALASPIFLTGCSDPKPPIGTVVLVGTLAKDSPANDPEIWFESGDAMILWSPDLGSTQTRSLIAKPEPGTMYLLHCDTQAVAGSWHPRYNNKWVFHGSMAVENGAPVVASAFVPSS
jgi:hypothetical protein